MKELNFNTNLVTYNVNGGCEITFNPTDHLFADKIYTAMDEMAKRQASIESDSPREVLDHARDCDKEMRGILDGIFGDGVSDALFPDVSTYALADGTPLWANFLVCILEEMDAAMEAEKIAKNPKMERYIAKYKKP